MSIYKFHTRAVSDFLSTYLSTEVPKFYEEIIEKS